MQGIVLLVSYTAFMLLCTVLFTKKADGIEFHVANRNMGVLQSSFSIAATWIWAPAIFVSAERAYLQGITGLFWFVAPNVLCLIIFIPFAKQIRRQMPEGITLSGFMRERHGVKTKNVYLFQLSALSVLSTGVNLLAVRQYSRR